MVEIFYRTLEQHGAEAALHVTKIFSKYIVDFGIADIEGSMKLRLKLKKDGLNISYADALGYYIALEVNVKFLTGDRCFKGLDEVEFVV